jgi:DNA-binding TFAR19-related protein (PDSD5 family)
MNQEEYMQAIEEQKQNAALKESALFNFMTKEARERYRRVEMVHPELANKVLVRVLQGVQMGKVKVVNDELLKGFLTQLNDNKGFNIIQRK